MALLLGVALGVIVAVVRTAHDQQRVGHKNVILGVFNAICKIYTTVIRGTPMMVQLLIMSLVVFASSRNYTMIGILALGINSGAYVSEIVRSGLMSVDPGQMEAGRSLGMNYFTTMRFIVIPQAVKNILPALGNEFITLLKDTSLITVIGGKEMTYAAKAVIAKTYQGLFPLFGIALMYLLLQVLQKQNIMKTNRVLLTFLLVVMTLCAHAGDNNSALRKSIAMANAMCPVSLGAMGEMTSMVYEKGDLIISYALNEDVISVETLKNNKEMVRQNATTMVRNATGDLKTTFDLLASEGAGLVTGPPMLLRNRSIQR